MELITRQPDFIVGDRCFWIEEMKWGYWIPPSITVPQPMLINKQGYLAKTTSSTTRMFKKPVQDAFKAWQLATAEAILLDFNITPT